jgi:hypothetical protein
MAEQEQQNTNSRRDVGWKNIFFRSEQIDNDKKQAELELSDHKSNGKNTYLSGGKKIAGALFEKTILPIAALLIGVTFLVPMLPVAGVLGFAQLGVLAAFGVYSVVRQGPLSLIKGAIGDLVNAGVSLATGKPFQAATTLLRTPLNLLTLGAAQEGFDIIKTHQLRDNAYKKAVKIRTKEIKAKRVADAGLDPKKARKKAESAEPEVKTNIAEVDQPENVPNAAPLASPTTRKRPGSEPEGLREKNRVDAAPSNEATQRPYDVFARASLLTRNGFNYAGDVVISDAPEGNSQTAFSPKMGDGLIIKSDKIASGVPSVEALQPAPETPISFARGVGSEKVLRTVGGGSFTGYGPTNLFRK